MPLSDSLQIAAPNPDGSITPPPSADELRQALEARNAQLMDRLGQLEEILARPLDQILAERDRFKDAAAAWDSFGAM